MCWRLEDMSGQRQVLNPHRCLWSHGEPRASQGVWWLLTRALRTCWLLRPRIWHPEAASMTAVDHGAAQLSAAPSPQPGVGLVQGWRAGELGPLGASLGLGPPKAAAQPLPRPSTVQLCPLHPSVPTR